jgi:hypothetical protein
MKPLNTISLCIATLLGIALGSMLHPFAVRAEVHPSDAHPVVYVQSVGTGAGVGVTATENHVIGFSCVSSRAPNQGENCYIASIK